MKIKKLSVFSIFFIYLTSVLTFFLLWISFSDKVANFYVKNYLNDWVSQVDIREKKFDFEDVLFWWNDLNLDKFWEVYNLVKSDYYSIDWIKKSDLVDWAITWLVDSLWDKHSEFMNIEETKQFNEALSWDFEWIWAVVDKNPIWVSVDRVLKWSPALKYGIKKWDIITKANWESLEELSLYDAVDKIKWPAWTKVVLTILRNGESDLLEIEVIREKIKIPSVDYEIMDENIGYISINLFWENTSNEFNKAIGEIKGVDWLIIDLRDNWWGYLQSAVQILSDFIEKWDVIVKTKYKKSFQNYSYKSSNNWEVFDKKIVVLINENTASASEITAWALRDYNKAILVWKKSYWKWSVQEPFYLEDGSLLKLTIAKWFTPKDRNIDKEWIEPDIEVSFEKADYTPAPWKEDEFQFYDRQLEEAKKVLKEFINLWSLWLTLDKFKN